MEFRRFTTKARSSRRSWGRVSGAFQLDVTIQLDVTSGNLVTRKMGPGPQKTQMTLKTVQPQIAQIPQMKRHEGTQ